MIDGLPWTLTVIAAVGAGLNAGVFFAFSTFVMRALDDLPASAAVAAMQKINERAPSPWFMAAFLGTAAVCVAVVVTALGHLGESWVAYTLVAGALYLVAIVLTAAYHVPRNNALALVDPAGPNAAERWSTYHRGWTAWNHVRTLACLASAVVFTLALRVT